MIETLVPRWVAAVEATIGEADTGLFPEEAALVANAVEKRRREFATVRRCARTALERLGISPVPIGTGARGEPQWPAGTTGSMTHCAGYGAAAVARTVDAAAVGIDAEPDEPLPAGVLDDISLPGERIRLGRLAAEHPGTSWDRLLFSAKESVYKTWYPLTHRWLDFHEAEIRINIAERTFRADLLVPGPLVDGDRIQTFSGRWAAQDGKLATAVTVPRATP